MSRFNIMPRAYTVTRLGRIYQIGPLTILIAKPLRGSRIKVRR